MLFLLCWQRVFGFFHSKEPKYHLVKSNEEKTFLERNHSKNKQNDNNGSKPVEDPQKTNQFKS